MKKSSDDSIKPFFCSSSFSIEPKGKRIGESLTKLPRNPTSKPFPFLEKSRKETLKKNLKNRGGQSVNKNGWRPAPKPRPKGK